MLYDYQYDVISIIAGIFLLVVYIMRRTYRTKSNELLLLMLVCNICGGIFDLASCYTISFPECCTILTNYMMALSYLFFYNVMGVLFFAYVDSKAKIPWMKTPAKIIAWVTVAIEAILIWTSPYTHLISYFDENANYQHGPAMDWLYVIAGGLLLLAAIMFISERRKFSSYQVMAVCSFIAAVFTGVLIQMLVPRLAVGQLSCTLVLFFIYTSLENPIYYTYGGTACLNRLAFLATSKRMLRGKDDLLIFAMEIKDYDNVREPLSLNNQELLSCRIAEFIQSKYKQRAFCIADDKFVILMNSEDEAAYICETVDTFFAKPIMLMKTSIKIDVNKVRINNISSDVKDDILESGINFLLDDNKEITDEFFDFETVIGQVVRRKDIIRIIRNAINEESFEVHYQPIRNVHTGKFSSMEALVRLFDEKYGFISPEEFIPLAESEGSILQIGEIVFKKVCSFIKESECIEKYGVDYVEINLSPVQCFQKDIVTKFMATMKVYEIRPEWINLEITETAAFEKNDVMGKNINEFHDMGITFSLDDYGSGFASIDYLFKLPVDIVKIDKSILWQAMKDANALVVLLSTLRMLKELGKHIVVEGVETQEMVDILVKNGCDYLQGYYYSKPLNEQKYMEFIGYSK